MAAPPPVCDPMAVCAFGPTTCGPGAESQERGTVSPLYLESSAMASFVLLGGVGCRHEKGTVGAANRAPSPGVCVYPARSSWKVQTEMARTESHALGMLRPQ